MTEYTVKEVNGVKTLHINGNQSVCPFVPALLIPMQNQFGQNQLQIQRFGCTIDCPHARYNKAFSEWGLTCSGATITHKIIEPEEDDTESNVIKLL